MAHDAWSKLPQKVQNFDLDMLASFQSELTPTDQQAELKPAAAHLRWGNQLDLTREWLNILQSHTTKRWL